MFKYRIKYIMPKLTYATECECVSNFADFLFQFKGGSISDYHFQIVYTSRRHEIPKVFTLVLILNPRSFQKVRSVSHSKEWKKNNELIHCWDRTFSFCGKTSCYFNECLMANDNDAQYLETFYKISKALLTLLYGQVISVGIFW